jgi:hypothetical protein
MASSANAPSRHKLSSQDHAFRPGPATEIGMPQASNGSAAVAAASTSPAAPGPHPRR